METYHIEAVVASDGTITVMGLPLKAGTKVHMVIKPRDGARPEGRYALRGQAVRYIEPFASVAEGEWEAVP